MIKSSSGFGVAFLQDQHLGSGYSLEELLDVILTTKHRKVEQPWQQGSIRTRVCERLHQRLN